MGFKISECILKGAQARPQVEGALFKKALSTDSNCGSCALGALWEGYIISKERSEDWNIPLSNDEQEATYAKIRSTFPLLSKYTSDIDYEFMKDIEHPSVDLLDTIIRLNDTYHWTREEIASWMASIERHYETV